MVSLTRRWFVTGGALVLAAAAADLEPAPAQTPPRTVGSPDPRLVEDLVAANRILADPGVPLRPLYHMSAFLWEGVPVFDIRQAAGGPSDMLVRTPALGRALAGTLGSRTAALMRGHGAVVVGPSLPQAVFRSVYLEMNARLQAQAMALGGPVTYLDPEEAKQAAGAVGSTVLRPWERSEERRVG